MTTPNTQGASWKIEFEGWYENNYKNFYELTNYIEELLSKERAEGEQQKYYELALQAQAIEMFMETDARQYGEIPLHGKFRAFFAKYIQPTLEPRTLPADSTEEV